MISKTDILNIVHKVKQGRSSRASQRFVFPMRDWLIGIGIFLVLITMVISYDLILFTQHSSLEAIVTSNNIKGANLDKELIVETIDQYQSKAEEFSRLRAFGQVEVVEEDINDVESEESVGSISETETLGDSGAEESASLSEEGMFEVR